MVIILRYNNVTIKGGVNEEMDPKGVLVAIVSCTGICFWKGTF